MKLNLRRCLILLLIVALSIGFGFGFDAVAVTIEKNNHPRPAEYTELIAANAERYGVPEPVLWAMVCVESDFASNAKGEGGAIGLLQLTPETFAMIQTDILKVETTDPGMLYDPATNLSHGCAYLSSLYQHYGIWETVFAAWDAGSEQVDAWLRNSAYSQDGATLREIPDADTRAVVKKASKAMNMYIKLYY